MPQCENTPFQEVYNELHYTFSRGLRQITLHLFNIIICETPQISLTPPTAQPTAQSGRSPYFTSIREGLSPPNPYSPVDHGVNLCPMFPCGPDMVKYDILCPHCPAEFLKIQRVHLQLAQVSDRSRPQVFEFNTKKRAAENVTIPPSSTRNLMYVTTSGHS